MAKRSRPGWAERTRLKFCCAADWDRSRSILGCGKESDQLSLSRLNHWLPWGQTDSEVMQGTTEFHHEIADAVLPQPDAVFHNAAALDAAIDMLDPQPTLVQGLVGQFLL